MPEETCREESIADVLLWAILANRQELAEICWLGGKDYLSKFLLLNKIYKLIYGRARGGGELVAAAFKTDKGLKSYTFRDTCY